MHVKAERNLEETGLTESERGATEGRTHYGLKQKGPELSKRQIRRQRQSG